MKKKQKKPRINLDELTLQNSRNNHYRFKKIKEKRFLDFTNEEFISSNKLLLDSPRRSSPTTWMIHSVTEDLRYKKGVYCIWVVYKDEYIPLYIGSGNIGNRILDHCRPHSHMNEIRYDEYNSNDFLFTFKDYIYYSYIIETEDVNQKILSQYDDLISHKRLLEEVEYEFIARLNPLENVQCNYQNNLMLMSKFVRLNEIKKKIEKTKKKAA
jgi:hypothetical protein|tara:strand:+ start:125 stop:760 length:636 start_codon:yes stop_codon:yes gene_type:complete